MDIYWHGGTQVTLKSKKDVITIDHKSKDSTIEVYTTPQDSKTTEPQFIHWPGEYEINESLFTGTPVIRKSGDKVTIYTLVSDEIAVCHLANIDRKLTDPELELIGNVEILFVPVGGNDAALTPKLAKEVIEQIEPAIVIPVLYKTKDEDLLPLADFLKEMGKTGVEAEKKLSIAKSKITLDRTDIVVLEPK